MASPPKTLPADFFETAAQPQAAHPEASAGPPPTLPANFFDSQQGSDAASRRIAAQDDQDNNGPRVQSLASFGSDPANDPHRLNEQTTQNGRIIAAAITTPPSLGGPVRGWVPGTTAPAALSAPVKGLTNQDTSNGTYYDEQGNLYRAHHNVQGPFQPGGKGAQALQDFTTKAGQVFSGANDPDNPMESSKALGIMLGAEALPGAAAVARNPLVKKALLGASTAVNTYFAYQTGKDATGATRQAWDLYKRGDYPGMAVKLGVGGTEALLAAIGVGNLVRTAKTAIGSKAAPKPANPPQEFTLTGEPVRQPAAEQEKANATTVEQPTAAQEPKAEEEISQKPPAEVQRPSGGAPAGPEVAANAGSPGNTGKPGNAANAGAQEVGEPRLPRELAGAKPRFNYGRKAFTLNFDSDLDKAAYITAQKTRSASDQKFVDFVTKHTGMDEAKIRARGREIRETIGMYAKDEQPGVLDIPRHDYLWPRRETAATAPPVPEQPPQSPNGGPEAKAESPTQKNPEPAATAPEPGPKQREPGWVGNIPTPEIQVDAPRFQFKRNVGQGGAGEELREVTKFDPEKAGITSVWRDPDDGKTYVVNGHHRVELAQRTKYPQMTVRYLDAQNAQQARMKGALINIAEGRGESTDAAKVFRDSGMTPEQLAAEGVSLKGKVAKEGLALSNLAQPIFDDVIEGSLSPARGAVIGEGVKNPADQVALYDLMKQREKGGRRLTNDQIGELIRLNNRTATQTHNTADDAQGGLFGAEEMTRSLLPEKAEVSDYVRKQLSTERKLFGAVSSQAAAEKLGEAGNVIKAGENSQVAERANQGLALYDKLSGSTGTIDTLLDRAAQSIADGEDPHEVKQRAYRAIKGELRAQADQLTGVPKVDDRRAEGHGGEGTDQAGRGERNPATGDHHPGVAASSSRVPKLSERGEAFLAGAPDSYHAHRMRLEEYPLDPSDARLATAYVTNPSGIEFVHRMTGAAKDVGGLSLGAMHLDPANAGKVAFYARLMARRFEYPPDGIVRLARAAEEASKAGKSFILTNDVPGRSDEDKLIGLNEELDHARQAALKGGSAQDHLGGNATTLTGSTLGQRAVRALEHLGYEFRSKGEAAAEVGVRLMRPGRNGELGLSPAEARTLGAEYVRALRKEHGSVKSREIARRVTSALRRGPEGRRGEPGSLPGSVRPEGGRGPRGGTEADTSGLGSRADSDLRREEFRPETLAGGAGARQQRALHLFFPDGEEESELAGKRAADKLLGDRLTAQVRSGMAVAPPKLKPAENRSLFDEEGPEQGGFNFEANRPPEVNEIPPDSKQGDKPNDLYFGSGLGALEPLFREAKAEGDALRIKRNEALKAAKDAEATPGETKAGEAIRHYFTSERDLWAARANQAIDVIDRKLMQKIQDREAMGIAREFRHRVGELKEFIAGTHPTLDGTDSPNPLFDKAKVDKAHERLLPVMREALRIIEDPTPREQAVDRVFTNIAEKSLHEGRAGGWLDSRWQSDEYVPHLLHAHGEGEVATVPSTAGKIQGKIGKFFGFSLRRSDPYPTTLHAVFNGIIPKTLDPSVAFRIHSDSFAQARATHLLEAHLADLGLGKWGDGKHVPAGWVQLAKHSDEFKKQFVAEDERSGENRVGHMGLYVPEYISKALSPITDPDFTAKIPGFAKLRTAQRGLKEAILGLSGFHLLTENAMAAADIGPAGMVKAFKAVRSGKNFLANERDLIASGGTTSIQGSTMDAYRGLRPGTIPTRGEMIRAYIPGSKQALEVADAITRLTFDNVQRRFKVVSFAIHRDAWIRDNPKATPAQLAEAKKGIASYVNGVYGGLHWENMGVSKAAVEVGRALFLAPDWTGSNVALAKYAMDAQLSRPGAGLRGAVSKQSTQARLSRAFWTKQIVGGVVGTQMLSLMFSGQMSKRPFQVYMGQDENGDDIYQNVLFRGSAGDLVNLATKMEEHGLLTGPGVFLAGKAAPVTKLGIHTLTGRDDLGREIAPKKNSFAANTVRGVGSAVMDVSPVPITMRSVYRQMIDDEAGKYLWSERMLSLFGPQAQHVSADREEREEEGDDRSFWEQVTGKREGSR